MIENYADKNREQTLDAVSEFGADRLQEFIEFEREHKDRKTVLEPLERELVTVTPTEQRYAGGCWFDDVDEQRVVCRTPRIERAIANGDLREVA